MQLFITDYQKNGEIISIVDSDLLSQIRKVLRARIGDTIWVQNPHKEPHKLRYEIRIDARDNVSLSGTIISEQVHDIAPEKKHMIIALPNKRDKVELIVQKLTECGLDQIIFWPSERSIIREWNPKKEERLQKIIKEAVEQSRGRTMPELIFTPDIQKYLQDTELIVFDTAPTSDAATPGKQGTIPKSHITGLVGPEGGLTPKDYQVFVASTPKIVSLGTTVLRIETAAIIGGRLIKNEKTF